jgi:hypothetical protein
MFYSVPSSLATKQSAFESSNSGRYFVILEEDFDAIPLISFLALKNKKTVVYVPSHQSLAPYNKIVRPLRSSSFVNYLYDRVGTV